MPYVTVGRENSADIQLHYQDHGSGEPVVLIHGWPLNGASWEKQEASLLASGHRVITYDRRGFGQSSQPSSGYDYDTFSNDLDVLMRTLDLSNVSLAGFSMGTGECARYLGRFGSSRVKRVVFIGSIPPCLRKSADNPAGLDENALEPIRQGIIHDRPALLTKFLSDFYNYDQLKGTRISEEVFHWSWSVGIRASAKGTLDCVATWLTDFRQDIAGIDIPALVIHGTGDRILPIAATGARLKDALRDCRYVELRGAPHGLLWTHANEVNHALQHFLQATVAASPESDAPALH